ncbi:MAG: DUF4956 domain-containing protein [Lachnospiraceae bacterium]|nr:DUF4956 domain-containing protein [Lachnospiraceae bacterium]
MLESLFGTTVDTSVELGSTVIYMLCAFALGIIISAVYAVISDKRNRSLGFMLTLILMPAATALTIIFVGSNVARAFSIAGIFALVRFRSAQSEGKDIALVFLGAAAGLACGLGFLSIAFVSVIILAVLTVVAHFVIGMCFREDLKQLRILIPEDMDYQDAFDDLFEQYTTKAELNRVKTTNMGTLYELTYLITLKPSIDEKKFLDELRVRNGNLTITLAKQLPKTEL